MLISEKLKNHKGKTIDTWQAYLSVYDKELMPKLETAKAVLEIGSQNGGRLELLSTMFPDLQSIVGVDINPNCSLLKFESKKVSLITGDVTHPEVQKKLKEKGNYDVIIDDASHKSSDIIQTFEILFQSLNHNGIYIVEDVHTSYWPEWLGGLWLPMSTQNYFKTLTDIINYEFWNYETDIIQFLKNSGIKSNLTTLELKRISSIRFYNSMIVIEKCEAKTQTLGKRRQFGQDDKVVSISLMNKFNPITYQRQIPKSSIRTPRLLIEELKKENQEKTRLIDELDINIVDLTAQLNNREVALQQAYANIEYLRKSLFIKICNKIRNNLTIIKKVLSKRILPRR